MAQDQNALVWLDMEMTGLNPDSDRIIELAMVVTNSDLVIVAWMSGIETLMAARGSLSACLRHSCQNWTLRRRP